MLFKKKDEEKTILHTSEVDFDDENRDIASGLRSIPLQASKND